MKTTEPPVIVEQIFDTSITSVWNAITKRDEMIQWYFDNIPSFKPEVGFKTQFNVKAPSRDFMHLWQITEVIPVKRLVYSWNFEGLDGKSFSIFDLEEIGTQTKLTLTTKVEEDFDDAIPEFTRESCVGGWNYFIKERLKDYLNN
jgi:uncharacterized protein YndB with AHSA1/START domain